MNVPFVDLKTQYSQIKNEVDPAIAAVLNNARFIQGQEVKEFEDAFSRYLGVRECVSLNSGTDALILGIRALEFEKGSEILVPVNTFIATALGISENGLNPVFVDCDPLDYGMDLVDLKRKISPRTKAILPVHLYGQPEKLGEIQDIIAKSGQDILLIEDACQSHGSYYGDKRTGSFGIFAAYSFYPGKNLGAYGDGGALVTSDPDLGDRVRKLREYGQTRKYVHESLGTNTRLDTIQAAVLKVKLAHLDEWNAKRQQWAARYTELINAQLPDIKTPSMIPDRRSVFHLYVIEVDRRDELLAYLNDHGIQALIHYPIPLHLQKAYGYLGYKQGDFPHAERMANRILSLPMHADLSEETVSFVVSAIRDYYAK